MSRFSKSNNPILNDRTVAKSATIARDKRGGEGPIIREQNETATVKGAIDKSLMLFGIMMITTYISYMNPSQIYLFVGMFGGLVAMVIAVMKPHTAPIVAPIYALLEGLFVGAISAIFAAKADGIVIQAVTLTFGTLLGMLVLYKTGIIKVTDKLRKGVMMATFAIMFIYIVSFVGSFVGFHVPYLHEGGPIGIGISVVIIGVAAMNLLLDFDMFEKTEKMQAPKFMEWVCALGLIVTLVWLYVEFLRLLAKIQSD